MYMYINTICPGLSPAAACSHGAATAGGTTDQAVKGDKGLDKDEIKYRTAVNNHQYLLIIGLYLRIK